MKANSIEGSLVGALAWRCGYATGLRVAMRMMNECNDPMGRIRREIENSMLEASKAYKEGGREYAKLN